MSRIAQGTRRPPATATGRSGATDVARHGSAEPKLPHEHDESRSSQDRDPEKDPVGKRAFHDVQSGRVDTDRGPPADDAYRRLKEPRRKPR